MPSVSERQRRFMGMELARKQRGEATQTGMSAQQLRDFARKGPRSTARARSRRSSRVGR